MTRSGVEAKPAWKDVPPAVRAQLERLLGRRIVRATRAFGGYAPSATFRSALDDGRRAFLKGTYPLPQGSAVQWVLEAEERAYRRLERWIRPWAPEYFGSVRAVGWHLIALEDVSGEAPPPWTLARARRATRSYASFHRASVGRPLPAWLSRELYRDFGIWWRRIGREKRGHARVAALARGHEREALHWLETAAPALRRTEWSLARSPAPYALLHFDTRSDNVRLQGDTLRMFDWPFVSVGPHEFDLAAFAQSITAEGGPKPEQVVHWYEETLAVRPPVLRAAIVGIAGYFADRAARPPLPGLPRLRSIQRRQLKASLAWAARALDLPPCSWLSAIPD